VRWRRVLEEFVEMALALWLFDILFKPKKSDATQQ
jgi:hypothetical protein